jgi:hypothetical protein
MLGEFKVQSAPWRILSFEGSIRKEKILTVVQDKPETLNF